MIKSALVRYRDLNRLERALVEYMKVETFGLDYELHEVEEMVAVFLNENSSKFRTDPSDIVVLNGIIKGTKTLLVCHKAVTTGNYCPIITIEFE